MRQSGRNSRTPGRITEKMETEYDAPQGVSKSGICSRSVCREEVYVP